MMPLDEFPTHGRCHCHEAEIPLRAQIIDNLRGGIRPNELLDHLDDAPTAGVCVGRRENDGHLHFRQGGKQLAHLPFGLLILQGHRWNVTRSGDCWRRKPNLASSSSVPRWQRAYIVHTQSARDRDPPGLLPHLRDASAILLHGNEVQVAQLTDGVPKRIVDGTRVSSPPWIWATGSLNGNAAKAAACISKRSPSTTRMSGRKLA